MNKLNNILLTLFTTLIVIFASSQVKAVVNPTADNITLDVQCANGRMGKGKCPAGQAYFEPSQYAYSHPLDTFEYTALPSYGSWAAETKYIWEVSEVDNGGNTRPQSLTVSQGQGLFGSNKNAMSVTVTGSSAAAGGMFLRLYNNHNTNINDYWWVRDLTNAHTLQKINRMRFWIKAPPSQPKLEDHRAGFHVGTYQRLSTAPASEQESNGWHHYHYYNLEYTNSWTQIIVDRRPHHKRGVTNDTLEPSVLTNMEAGYDYFDLMTYFYITSANNAYTAHPATTLVDGFEFYEEPYEEDEFGIYAISGTIDQSGQLVFKWSVDINDTNDLFDIKYAYTSFHENGGWSHGQYAPNGQNINPPATQSPSSYNGAAYRTSEINYGANSAIYIAVKNQNQPTLFREMRIPITQAGFPYLPSTTPDLTEPN